MEVKKRPRQSQSCRKRFIDDLMTKAQEPQVMVELGAQFHV